MSYDILERHTGKVLLSGLLTLTCADLRGANLQGAALAGESLQYADLRGADLRVADLQHADLRGADLPEGVPVIPEIDARILEAVETPGNRLQMRSWHSCATVHCRAGWAIALAGDAGLKLEERFGSGVAGTLIYVASRPGRRHPDFYTTDAGALASIRADATS